jgi:drug/metabolite transporter (DMT)-like permease
MTPDRRNDALPLLIGALAVFMLSTMDVLIKALPNARDTFGVVLVRYVAGAPFALALALALKAGWPTRAQFFGHLQRTLCFLAAASLFFFALARLPLAELFALTYTSPIFVSLFGWLLLKEAVSWRTGVALLMGFAGVLLIVLTRPEAAGAAPAAAQDAALGAAAAIASPVIFGLGIVLMRSQATKEPSIRLELMQRLIGATLILPVVLFSGQMAGVEALFVGDAVWVTIAQIMAIGLIGTLGGLALGQAFARAPAARVMTVEYTGIIWAGLYGVLFFAEQPRLMLFAGAALIIAGALFAMQAPKPEPHEVQEVA